MAKQKTVAPLVLKMAEIEAMPQSTRVETFALKDLQGRCLCVELGKLFRAIEAALPKTSKGIFPTLQAVGVKKGNISNASYVAKVFDLVAAGKLTEEQFDSFTFTDCLAIVRVLSAGSKKRLTVEEVAARIKASDDFEPDLHELYSSGLTAAEAKAANALAAAAKVKQDAIDAAAAKLAASAVADLKGVAGNTEPLAAIAHYLSIRSK